MDSSRNWLAIGIFVLGVCSGGGLVKWLTPRDTAVPPAQQVTATTPSDSQSIASDHLGSSLPTDSASVRKRLLEQWNNCSLRYFPELEARAFGGGGGHDLQLLNADDLLGLMVDLKKTAAGSPQLLSELCELEAAKLNSRDLTADAIRAYEEALDWVNADDIRQTARRMRISLFLAMSVGQKDRQKQIALHREALDHSHAHSWEYTTHGRDYWREFHERCQEHELSLAELLPDNSEERIIVWGASMPFLKVTYPNLDRFLPTAFVWRGYETWSWCDRWLRNFKDDEPDYYPKEMIEHVRAVRDFMLKQATIDESSPYYGKTPLFRSDDGIETLHDLKPGTDDLPNK